MIVHFLQLKKNQNYERQKLIDFVRTFYTNRGIYALIIYASKEKYVILKFDRGGSYRNTRFIFDEK
jgi:hypothetical protein